MSPPSLATQLPHHSTYYISSIAWATMVIIGFLFLFTWLSLFLFSLWLIPPLKALWGSDFVATEPSTVSGT